MSRKHPNMRYLLCRYVCVQYNTCPFLEVERGRDTVYRLWYRIASIDPLVETNIHLDAPFDLRSNASGSFSNG